MKKKIASKNPILVIFDNDGTLVNSCQADKICYVRAIKESFGINYVDDDWSHYRSVCDTGIAEDIYRMNFGKKISTTSLLALKKKFVELIKLAAIDEKKFREILGAHEVIMALKRMPHIRIAIATGGWRASTLLKLKAAKINIGKTAVASSDDGNYRMQIVGQAIKKAKKLYRVKKFSRIISVGDGIWDYKTAKEMKLEFVGVGSAVKFCKKFNLPYVKNYLNIDKFFRFLRVV